MPSCGLPSGRLEHDLLVVLERAAPPDRGLPERREASGGPPRRRTGTGCEARPKDRQSRRHGAETGRGIGSRPDGRDMQIEVTGRVALVTGGSRGIGLGIARRFCEAGGDVMLVSRSAENLEVAAASLEGLDGTAAWTVAHVGRPAEAEAAVAATLERFGALDVLVNNAGTNPYFGPLLGIDDVRLQKTFEINQASIVTWSRAAWNQWLSAHGGAILNVASIGGLGAEPGIGWYNATKAAVIHLTRQLALELAPTVRVERPRAWPRPHGARARALGAQRGADRRDAAARADRRGGRRRADRAPARLGCCVVDHGPDDRCRRRDDDAVLRWGQLSPRAIGAAPCPRRCAAAR